MATAGFDAPDAGRAPVRGEEVAWAQPNRRGIGLDFRRHTSSPHMSGREDVALPPKMRSVVRVRREGRARAVPSAMRLDRAGARRPAQPSGGRPRREAPARRIIVRRRPEPPPGSAMAHMALALPFAAFAAPCRPGPDPKEAALSCGAGAFGVVRRVALPLVAPGTVSVAPIAFAMPFDEAADRKVLPSEVPERIGRGVSPSLAAVAAEPTPPVVPALPLDHAPRRRLDRRARVAAGEAP